MAALEQTNKGDFAVPRGDSLAYIEFVAKVKFFKIYFYWFQKEERGRER